MNVAYRVEPNARYAHWMLRDRARGGDSLVRVLVVFAHARYSSFQATLYRTAVMVLRERGHEVDDFDLYADITTS